jgi:hypothetical protein
MSRERMKPIDRMLCITAALFGIGAFIFALHVDSNPMGLHPAGHCRSASSA